MWADFLIYGIISKCKEVENNIQNLTENDRIKLTIYNRDFFIRIINEWNKIKFHNPKGVNTIDENMEKFRINLEQMCKYEIISGGLYDILSNISAKSLNTLYEYYDPIKKYKTIPDWRVNNFSS